MKFVLVLLVFFEIAAAEIKSYYGHRVLRVTVKNADELQKLSELEDSYDFWTDARFGWVDIMATPSQKLEAFLEANKISYALHISNVGSLIQEVSSNNTPSDIMNWENYQRIETIHAFLDKIAATYLSVAKIISIGNSTEGRDLKVIKIGRPGQKKPAIWIDGGIHAREWISPAITTWMINQLLTNNENEDLLNSVDFYILPSANPDGYEHSHVSDRLWRKTRSINSGSSCVGVDPNRNFEFHFGGPGSSNFPCSEVYRGTEAWSEPETKAIRDFVFSTKANWQVYIAVHSYAQMWLTPWGYTYDLPEDYEELIAFGKIGADALTAVHGTPYRVGSVTQLLSPGAGGSDDWAKGLGGFKYSQTVEVRDTGMYGFVLPPDQIIPTAEETWAGFQAVSRWLVQQQ